MTRIKACLFLVYFLGLFYQLAAQSTEISGKVNATSDKDRIHIINKTANRFTITNDSGEFRISVSENDTLQISAIQYKPVEIIITSQVINAKFISVKLSEKITELDEVVVGKVLTGDLQSDIENSDVKRDINFYDVGIPGYTGKPKTQSERRLIEATTGAGFIPLNPILNWISGRTKELKDQIERERVDRAMESVISDLSELLFEIEELDELKRNEFFYFVTDDPKFMELNNLQNDFKMFEFLRVKLKAFKSRMEKE